MATMLAIPTTDASVVGDAGGPPTIAAAGLESVQLRNIYLDNVKITQSACIQSSHSATFENILM